MNKRFNPSRGRKKSDQLGSLGEQLLAAGISLPEASVGNSSKRPKSKRNPVESERPQKAERIEGDGTKAKGKKKGGKSKKRKKGKQRHPLLAIMDRQNERKQQQASSPRVETSKSSQGPVTAIPERPYSIKNVQARMRKLSKSLQKMGQIENIQPFASNGIQEISGRFSSFQSMCPLLVEADEADLDLVLGFDFGSTSSKLVLRFPYEEGLGAFAVPSIEDLYADAHPYYWDTKVWECTNGAFSLTPEPGAYLHNHLKVSFLRENHVAKSGHSKSQVVLTAYLAMMIRQALGWLWQRLERALNGRAIAVSANFGFPAETGGCSPQLDGFTLCAKAALELATSASKISAENVETTLENEAHKNASKSSAVLVVPEFIGAVMGYFHSSQKKDGQFMICDFGGLTVDAVCFGFFQSSNGDPMVKIYGSAVAPFGAEIAKKVVEQGVPKSKLATAVGGFICDPIKDSYQKTSYNAPAWGGNMPLFVIGGGRHYDGYESSFSEAERLIKNSWFKTEFKRLDLDLHDELDISLARGMQSDRLMVAWGLSHSDLDLPEWLTRGELKNGLKPRKKYLDDFFVGKEQT
ncbi:hypothetical protein [Ruegeria arenilitoris]|uniref:hypothetical protein n=1 Tax=Ruegeria arenilitoris TaxID=1173585 RepID=UPI00147D58CA|nr:hypothetical protein [Ruegeria arenilitoris]